MCEDLNTLHQRSIQMTKKQTKDVQHFYPIIRKMKIKITVIYHYTLSRVAKI